MSEDVPSARHATPTRVRVSLVLLVAATAALAAVIGGTGGLIYLCLYGAATLPGWPIGRALFGRGHIAGWAVGAASGYALTAFAFSAAIVLGVHAVWQLAGIWLVLSGGVWFAASRLPDRRALSFSGWTDRDTAALGLVLLLVPGLCSVPFAKVGVRDPDGSRAYRAYFTMDFFWHTALTAEVSKFTTPPRNPYLAESPLHYYWTYFAVPAAVLGHGAGVAGLTAQTILLVNALATGILLLAMIFLLARAVVPRAGPVVVSVALVVLASSAEGLYAWVDFTRRGKPFVRARGANIDAIAAWVYGGLRVDDLPRSFWWVPQHASACALALVALLVVALGGVDASLGMILLAGAALGASVTLSPLLGAAFSLVYGVAVTLAAVREPRAMPGRLGRHALAAIPVVLALVWCLQTGVLEGASGSLEFGLGGLARHAPVRSLVLSLGPALLPALIGLWPVWRLPRAAGPACAGLLVGLTFMYFVWVPLDMAYVGFRAGQVVLVTLPGLVALAIDRWRVPPWRRAMAWVVLVVLFAVGLPTTIIDWYNAQDTDNRGEGPGFHWTITVTPLEQRAFTWIRSATDPLATVQMEPTSRGRETWTLIPTFAQRRMAAGFPSSLLQRPEFAEQSARARVMYESTDPAEACAVARELGVDYVYFDRTERAAFSAEALAKFDRFPECFHEVFANDEVHIYAIRPGSASPQARASTSGPLTPAGAR